MLKIAAFVAVWSLYFAITEYAGAIHNDMAEAYAWGREFQLGYNQHPPFWAWVCGLWFLIFPRSNAAFALLAMLNAGVGLLGGSALVRRLKPDSAEASLDLLILTPFYTFLAYKFNANSIFLSLWPWSLYFFVISLRGGELRTSIGFGLMMGLMLNAKYFALILAMTCLLAAVASEYRARYFRSPAPFVAFFVALALWAPHLCWLYCSGAPPLHYLSRISGRPWGEMATQALAAVVGVLLSQLWAWGLVTAVPRARADEEPAELRLVAILTLAPVVLSVVGALMLSTKLSSNMLIGVFPLSPLLAIVSLRPDLARLSFWARRAAVGISCAALGLAPLIAVAKAWYGPAPEDWEPRREAAIEATRFWQSVTAAPLRFVAGSFRYDNATVFYSPQHPSVFVNFDYFGNRWVAPERIRTLGLLTVCLEEDRACLARTAAFSTPAARSERVSVSHRAFGRARPARSFVMTAIPPV